MSYIYHLKPEPLVGNHLIPLNQMDQDSELYKKHIKKYEGRESLTQEIIPILNCKWNDVVQFSALNPQIILNELIKINTTMKITRPYYYKVHIDDILINYKAVAFNRDKTRKIVRKVITL